VSNFKEERASLLLPPNISIYGDLSHLQFSSLARRIFAKSSLEMYATGTAVCHRLPIFMCFINTIKILLCSRRSAPGFVFAAHIFLWRPNLLLI